MKRHLSSIAGLLSLVIGVILLKVFGSRVAIGFLIIAALTLVGANAAIVELLKQRRKTFRAEIKRKLHGETMCEFLKRNPDHLREIQRWDQGEQAALLQALDIEDAANVKPLLAKGSQAPSRDPNAISEKDRQNAP